MLRGRRTECTELDQTLLAAQEGRGKVLVLRGEAGIGKTALLDYLAERAAGFRVVRAAGVESDMELTYAGLYQLCGPLLDRLGALPGPQASALATAFGLDAGAPPDRFVVGLATLSLLSEAAEREPLACIVDDVQWLDQTSTQLIGFVGRRLLAERIALVCAVRSGHDDVLSGLPELPLTGLPDRDARSLLAGSVHGPLDVAVRERIVIESRGNPLALQELPRTWRASELDLQDPAPVAGRIERSYAQRLRSLPRETQLLVLVAAAEPLGDPGLLTIAARELGLDPTVGSAAQDAGLLRLDARVTFDHPLVRSAAYRMASVDDRRRVHAALAHATDAALDPDRRAWHRARATPGPDEEVAAELESSADRARARGGAAAAAAFLRRSVALTLDPAGRSRRALLAAQTSLEAGAFEEASEMLRAVDPGSLGGDLTRARVKLLAGRIASASSYGAAATQLLAAGKELEPLDPALARETYLDAWGAALAAGDGSLRDVSWAARAAPPAATRATDVLLDGLALLVTEGVADAVSSLRAAVDAFREEPKVLQWGAVAATAAAALWDIDGFDAIITRQLRLARDSGALALLATALHGAGIVTSWCGDFRTAASLTSEADAVSDAIGVRISPYGGILLAALRGREPEATALFDAALADARERGEGLGVQYVRWAGAVLANGQSRHGPALKLAREASSDAPGLFVSAWALSELVEAAAREGDSALAADAAQRLFSATLPTGSDWAVGIAARARALISEGEGAGAAYGEAIERLGRTPLRPELARAHLLHGEWLRREGKRVEARARLFAAHEHFTAMGMEAYAGRARRELLAAGHTLRADASGVQAELTPQEEQIARLARDGLSNPEIGAQLFLSPRTVEWHLHRVFVKLGIRSRRELRGALP